MKRVVCTVKFHYDPDSYLFEWDEGNVPDEEIFRRCKEMMLEDINEGGFDTIDFIEAEFVK